MANPYLALAQGLKGMNETDAKRIYREKAGITGFDASAFADATREAGMGGGNGFNINQINRWAENPTVNSDYTDLAKGLQGMIANGNERGAKNMYADKVRMLGSNFDKDAFRKATANLGMGGPNGFSQDQIDAWGGNPNTQVQEQRKESIQDYNPFMLQAPPPPKLDEYKKNPYLDEMAAGITNQMTDAFNRNIAPGIRSGAMAAGGFGGSRQGVVESNALNDLNRSLGQNLTNLYGQDYQQTQGRNLQKYQGDQSYGLGVGNLGLATINSMNAFDLANKGFGLQNEQFNSQIYQNNFNNSLNAGRFGLDAFSTMNNLNTQGTNNATTMQNAPLNYFNNTNNNTMAAAGTGAPNQVAPQGNPWMAGAGAGLATYGALTNGTNGPTGGQYNFSRNGRVWP